MVLTRIARLTTMVCLLALGATANGCSAGDGEVDETDSASAAEPLTAGMLPKAFDRVAIGRMYQHAGLTIEALDGASQAQRVSYICKAFAKLDPTYVSGLVRLDDEELLSPDQVQTFNAVRRCIRKAHGRDVRFDVVLNAEHYADPRAYPAPADGAAALQTRLEYIKATLAPDIWFFDFYTVPLNCHEAKCSPGDDPSLEWNKGPINAGIDWIHRHGGVVGGNVWGRDVPAGTDFAAIDDSNGPSGTASQARALAGIPILMHVRNDPQIVGSQGIKFAEGDHDYRVGVVDSEFGAEKRNGYQYMMPVFFPLHYIATPTGKRMVSYDATEDRAMLDHESKLLGK